LARKLPPNDEVSQKRWMLVHQNLLDQGAIKRLTVALRSIHTDNPELADKIRLEADYFHRNALRNALSQVSPPTPVCRLRRD
jgi:hypothetical protein